VAAPVHERPLRMQAPGHGVADALEDGRVAAGYHELRERRAGERLQRRVALPRGPLAHQMARAGEQLALQLAGRLVGRADAAAKGAQELEGSQSGTPPEEQLAVGDLFVDALR